jgi:hydroxyacylglutathione hydrolase
MEKTTKIPFRSLEAGRKQDGWIFWRRSDLDPLLSRVWCSQIDRVFSIPKVSSGFLTRIGLAIMLKQMKYERIVVGALETNCYLVYCEETRKCAVVDPGADADRIISLIDTKEFVPSVLINTHGHIDHVGANKDIKEKFGIPLCIHASDSRMLDNILATTMGLFLGAKKSPKPDRFLEDGDEIQVGNKVLKVIHTPGHSPGSISLAGDGFLLTGDVLFCGGVGRTDLPGGSWKDLEESIRNKIYTFPDATEVLPGHGPITTVGQEKISNPFVR